MSTLIVGQTGPFAGQNAVLGGGPLTFGRNGDNGIVIVSPSASRLHAEIVEEDAGFVLYDRGSRNGTFVNGDRVTRHVLRPNDRIRIGDETFLYESPEAIETVMDLSLLDSPRVAASENPGVLHVTVSGGGPVGLAFALMARQMMGEKVSVTVYDGRWTRDGEKVVWKDETQGNFRRQQVVTVQSRQWSALPEELQTALFDAGEYTEMWPVGPDSVAGRPPRNIRIAYVEDRLLELADKTPGIRLVPKRFDPAEQEERLSQAHVLAVCEGGRSHTREYFGDRFGAADSSIYSLDGEHLQDVVLGLRVKSALPDPMAVLLTVSQNRFLLNALSGEGFLNMRLTRDEARDVIGIDPVRQVFEECVGSRPCLMVRGEGDDEEGEFRCATHGTLFLPALLRSSPLWRRIRQGLKLFGVPESDFTAVTSFRLDMVQRVRFTARLSVPTTTSPGTYGFLLGDAANAIHFWPGRGLNSGLASALSLARSLTRAWNGKPLRDADFIRHEAAMSMLQYRHKSRAWNAMVTTDGQGETHAIRDIIARSMEDVPYGGEGDEGGAPRSDLDALTERMAAIRDRLAPRLPGMPDDTELRDHLARLDPATLKTLERSGAWDTLIVGGEEADIDIFYQSESPVYVPRPTDPRTFTGTPATPEPVPANPA
ncbi:FHA domain-containing protein [Streptomyces sp. NPDC050560]|uniref:FHA domain-containing protein n=1 Tax=Streptomyces sp. NPDC050560 TaxID=3365630 RepID=UPI0037966183